MHRRKLLPVLILFGVILFYNYFDIWQGMSLGPTHIQRARYFIEKNISEFTNICVTSNGYIPQLNMTEDSYNGLIKNRPIVKNIKGYELSYKDFDNMEDYDSIYKKLRIESLVKNPQYNLIMWDTNIKTEGDAAGFLKKNNIKYIISNCAIFINNKKIEDTKIASMVREFKPNNKRIYEAVYGDVGVFIYKVNQF